MKFRLTAPDLSGFHEASEEITACQEYRASEECASIRIGDRSYRYSLHRASQPTSDTVLVDLGGPGIALLSGQHQLASQVSSIRTAFISEGLPEYNFLFIEEPWATVEYNQGCEQSASEFYTAVREGKWASVESHGHQLSEICNFGSGDYGFTPELYQSAVEKVTQHEAISISGFIGYSFGSARLSYLNDASEGVKIEWTILTSPYPIRQTASEITEARSDAITDQFDDLEVSTDLVEVEGRSAPVVEFDRWSAIIASSHLNDSQYSQFVSELGVSVSDSSFGTLSDRLWKRYGTDDISPAMIGFFEEACLQGGALNSSSQEGLGINFILRSFWAPCQGDTLDSTIPSSLSKVCVAASTRDAVVPIQLVHDSFGKYSEVYEIESRLHGDPKGFFECLSQIAS